MAYQLPHHHRRGLDAHRARQLAAAIELQTGALLFGLGCRVLAGIWSPRWRG